jgi:hypothetical protein
MTHRAPLTTTLTLVLTLASGNAQPDAPLPLAPIGGIPIEIVVEVDFDYRDAIDGYELESYAGSWTHTQEGRLFRDAGWLAHADRVEDAHGSGRLVCWYDWGQPEDTPHWTVQWSSELTLPEPGRRASAASFPLPPIHVDIEGSDVLVIYAPPREFTFWFPGSQDDCQDPDPVPAHEATAYLVFDLDEVDVARPQRAHTSRRRHPGRHRAPSPPARSAQRRNHRHRRGASQRDGGRRRMGPQHRPHADVVARQPVTHASPSQVAPSAAPRREARRCGETFHGDHPPC